MKHQLLSLWLLLGCLAACASSAMADNSVHASRVRLEQNLTTNAQTHANPSDDLALRARKPSQKPFLLLAQEDIGQRKAAAIAKAAFGGNVMNVSKKGGNYNVKLLSEGRVRIVRVNAATGKIQGS